MLPKTGHTLRGTAVNLTASRSQPFEKHKPLTTVNFEQQLDYISEWASDWESSERFVFIEKLLSKCDIEQVQLLWTVLQPTLHRDFIFSSLSTESDNRFNPISIPVTREVHKHGRLLNPKGRRVPFLKSAVLRNEEEVRRWASCSVLPIMKSPMPASVTKLRRKSNVPHQLSNLRIDKNRFFLYRGSPEVSSGFWKSQQSYFGIRFPGIQPSSHSRSVLSIRSAPPKLVGSAAAARCQPSKKIFRRHMQKHQSEQNVQEKVPSCKENVRKERVMTDSWFTSPSPSIKPQDLFTSKPNQMLSKEAQTILHWFEHDWDDWKKDEFLQVFLKLLDPSELFFMSGLMAVRQYKDFIALLPRKLSRFIFSFLKVRELVVVSQVSSGWNSIANDEYLWKEKCRKIYIGVPLSKSKHWKTMYKESLELENNWCQGQFSVQELAGHSKRVLVVTAFENLIASGSFDKTIKIWNTKSGNLIQTLEGHSKGVWSLCFVSSTILVSGSYDSTIKIWSLRNGTCIKILLGHSGPVWAMERKGDTLLTGSGDKTAKVWNIRHCQLDLTLVGHTGSVFCVDLDQVNNRAFTGSADHSVRIWDLDSGECLKYFYVGTAEDANAVTCISYEEGFLAATSGTCVSLWNIDTKTCVRELLGHQDRVEAVKLKIKTVCGKVERGFIYSSGKDGVIKYWDFHEGTCLKSLRGHVGSVNSLFVDDTRIVSGSEDTKIRVWNFLPRSATNRQRKIRKITKS